MFCSVLVRKFYCFKIMSDVLVAGVLREGYGR